MIIMSRNKSPGIKARLSHALRSNRNVPVFAAAKTNRGVTRNFKQRHWRRRKLKLTEA